MSNRDTIIAALNKATVAIVEELADVTSWPERKVRDTLSDLKKLGIVITERDDVSGKAAYRLANPKAAMKVATNATCAYSQTEQAVKHELEGFGQLEERAKKWEESCT